MPICFPQRSKNIFPCAQPEDREEVGSACQVKKDNRESNTYVWVFVESTDFDRLPCNRSAFTL